MRLAFAVTAAVLLAAGAAQAADTQLMCRGEAMIRPTDSKAPLDVKLTVQGGLEAPTVATYAWPRSSEPVAMSLKGLNGDTLSFHGMAAAREGGVTVADAKLNRANLALTLNVRRMGAPDAEEVVLETSCQP